MAEFYAATGFPMNFHHGFKDLNPVYFQERKVRAVNLSKKYIADLGLKIRKSVNIKDREIF